MRLRTFSFVAFVALALGVATPALAAEDADGIAWVQSLPEAFAEAKKQQKILMVCVNAQHVAGASEEPAAKGLREVVYRHLKVVEKSRAFVCAFLTPASGAASYGELRALGVDGTLVSPQHIFVHPDGTSILLRREYWSYGTGERAVQALTDMMDKAHAALDGGVSKGDVSGIGEPAADAATAPAEGEERVVWIETAIQRVLQGDPQPRDAAIASLVQQDKDGDCVSRLIELMELNKKDVELLVALVRGLGHDGLESAAEALADQLRHKDPRVHGNAAVSLEYVGSREKAVLTALRRLADKTKDPSIANHAYRALGRCGSKDAKVRALLLKKASSAKSEFASYGPCIALAYFVQDKQAAPGVEKLLKRIGIPGSRRGGGQNVVKRGLVSWTLAAIRDPKSGPWVREELIGGLEHVKAPWVQGLVGFWDVIARHCDGDEDLLAGIEVGVRAFVSYSKNLDLARYGAEVRNLMDAFRRGREAASFRPMGDGLLDDEGA